MILILTQCFPPVTGGIENLLAGMAQALVEQNRTVLVYADHAPAASGYDQRQRFSVRRFGGWKPLRRRYKAFVVNRLLGNDTVSGVFCDSWKSLEWLRCPATIPITVLAHGSEFPLSPSSRKKTRIVNSLHKAHHILAISAATRERIWTCCGGQKKPVRIWNPPISIPLVPDNEVQLQAKEIWGDAAPRLLSVARLEERKGLDTAIAAFAKIAREYPQGRYVIAGQGTQEPRLRAQAMHLGIDRKIDFIGTVSEPLRTALYASADIFILPAKPKDDDIEGFGLVFLEAGYWATPSVAGHAGGAAEAVEDGITGLHCDGNDAGSVALAIKKILSDEDLRHRLSQAAQQKAHNAIWPKRVAELLQGILTPPNCGGGLREEGIKPPRSLSG